MPVFAKNSVGLKSLIGVVPRRGRVANREETACEAPSSPNGMSIAFIVTKRLLVLPEDSLVVKKTWRVEPVIAKSACRHSLADH
jgi:hypothetical protein